jgi:hypothetical protein
MNFDVETNVRKENRILSLFKKKIILNLLRAYNYSSHSSFTSNDISIIVKHVNNHLKQLKFDKHFKIDSSVFLKVISACPNLQFLRLPIIENVQENFMQE